MSTKLILHCPACNARIKASRKLLGQSRPCPGCGTTVTVEVAPDGPHGRPARRRRTDSGPILVYNDQESA